MASTLNAGINPVECECTKNYAKKFADSELFTLRRDHPMLMLNIILSTVLALSVIWTMWRAHQMKKQQSFFHNIGKELDSMLATLNKNHSLKKDYSKSTESTESNEGPMIGDPSMLSTLITVIVNKYGTLRVGIDDFTNIPENEYVSIYVDTTKQDILLSMDHSMAKSDPLKMVNYTDSDDGTYH